VHASSVRRPVARRQGSRRSVPPAFDGWYRIEVEFKTAVGRPAVAGAVVVVASPRVRWSG
jgi:hypothetical protein